MSKLVFAHLTAVRWLVVALGAALAVVLSLFLRGDSLRLVVPAMFLLVVIVISHGFDRLAGVITAAIACVIFAALLFEPYGTLEIRNTTDRLVFSGYILAALAVVLVSPRSGRRNLARARSRR